eukprot:282894_1
MASSKKTLDFLVSDVKKKETNNIDTHKNNNSNTKKKKERPPPPIPPSPKTKHDETLQTDLLLRKFELDAANESWEQNTIKKVEFNNMAALDKQIAEYGLNHNKYHYQSFIKHTKTKIIELIEDGASIHIVRQFSDIGCPTIKNPNTKKGCWCIEETKKQKKSAIHHKPLTIKPTAIHTTNTTLNLKANAIMENFRRINMQNTTMFNTKTNATSTVDIIQNNLILNARTHHYMPSNRMQQIRMQQMLLNARTNNNNKTTIIPTSISQPIIPKESVLGARTHKDTIVFSSNTSSEPPTKRRKKSRWSTSK